MKKSLGTSQGSAQRMLREHLSQAHDAASHRLSKIDDHVAWIHADLLAGRPARVLGLGCVAARRAALIESAPPGSRAGHRRKRHISASGEVERYASSMQAYSEAEYSDLITTSGYNPLRLVPSLPGRTDPEQSDLFVLVCKKPVP